MSASHAPSKCKEPGSFTLHDPSFANEQTDNAVDERSKIAAAEPVRLLSAPDERRKVSTGGLSTPGSFLKSQRIRELLSESHNSMSSSLASAEASSEDESFQQSIGATYRPKLNITGIEGNWASKENMNTPRRSRPLSLGKQIARNFDQILEQFGVNEDLNGLLDNPSPGLQTGPVQGAPPASCPLVGAIVCVSKRLSHVQKELGDIVRELATDSTKPSVITSLPLPDSESQFVGITWDDPTRRMEMARLAGKLAEMEPASQPATEQSPDRADDNVFEEAEPVVEPPPKVFVISGFSDEQKIRYASIISKLNGVLLTSKAYNPEMTHLVLLQALKNERYLAALAAGKFVLHAAYLDESAKAGKFLDEEEYEWGGPLTESCLMNLSTASTKSHKGKGQQAFAPRRWRQRIGQDADHKGAFSNWRVAIYASASKEAAYVNILTAGGATIVPTAAVCAGLEAGEITHALFDSGMAKGAQLDLLVSAGVLCLKAEYMATFLVDDPVPPPEKFYIPEVLKLLDISVSTNSSTSASKRTAASTSNRSNLALGAKRKKP
ncbi:hypothetical protein HPB49_026604 [Dermacentor silvarum]|nr:hypothetical protein HPB49_026604 [Dermacentor silvarum]